MKNIIKIETVLMRLIFIVLVFLSLKSCKVADNRDIKFFEELEQYYNEIIPREFPEFHLNDDQYSIVIWNAPGQYSYVINSDTVYSDPDNDRRDIRPILMSDDSPSFYKFRSNDSIVGFSFVNSDTNLRTGKTFQQMNIYGPEFFSSAPENEVLDYLPVLVHELAHMTERHTKIEGVNTKELNVSPFALMIHFESDSIFREQIIEENNLLLAALNAPEKEIAPILDKYFELQKIRKETAPDSLMNIEPSTEASEGYARYVEYLCKSDLDSTKVNKLAGFKIKIPKYDLSEQKWMYDASYGNSYMYATGFNKIRLLLKYKDTEFIDVFRGLKPNNLDPYLRKMKRRS